MLNLNDDKLRFIIYFKLLFFINSKICIEIRNLWIKIRKESNNKNQIISTKSEISESKLEKNQVILSDYNIIHNLTFFDISNYIY